MEERSMARAAVENLIKEFDLPQPRERVRAHNLSMGEKLVVLDYGRERLYTEEREESQGASRAAEEITCVGYHH
jgi:hypothetical protein